MAKSKTQEITAEKTTGGAKKVTAKTASKPVKGSKSTNGSKSMKSSKPASGMKAAVKTERHFKLIDGETGESIGRYSGDTPKQAASKGYSKRRQAYKASGKTAPKSEPIHIRESTRGSPKRLYAYEARRIKLDNPHVVKKVDKDTNEVKEVTYKFRNQIKRIDVPDYLHSLTKTTKKVTKGGKPAKATKATKTTKGSKTAKTTKATKSVKATKPVKVSKPSKATTPTKPSKSTKVSKTTKATKAVASR